MTHRLTPFVAALFFAACTADAEPEAGDSSPVPAASAVDEFLGGTVRIVEPAEGDTVEGPTVTVRLEASGVRIVQAGDTTTGTGHHHLFLDDEVSPSDQPIPTVAGRIIHMGDGSEAYVFDDVAAGEHRLIAVVADGVHMPLQPWVVDTVTFTVRR